MRRGRGDANISAGRPRRLRLLALSVISAFLTTGLISWNTYAGNRINELEQLIARYKVLRQPYIEFMRDTQLENGAYAMRPLDESASINPYFACYTAIALLECGNEYAPEVKKYLDWHFANLNTSADAEGLAGDRRHSGVRAGRLIGRARP